MELLTDLLGYKGKLKIVTSEVNPDRPDGSTCLRYSYFIQHDVVRIEGTRKGTIKAYSEEGDHCSGYPVGVLRSLTKWKTDALGI